MKKYYDKELSVAVNVMYGGRRAGVTYREIENLKKENEELTRAWEDAQKSWERQVNKVGKAIRYLDNTTPFDMDSPLGVAKRDLLKILKDGK